MKISVATLALILSKSQTSGFTTHRIGPKSAFTKPTSKIYNSNNDIKSDYVDKAPCFDSVCSSDPDVTPASPSMGEATQRLGIASGPTVWTEFGRISMENPSNANLGQGFPDWLPPQFAIDALVEGATDVMTSPHQYTRTAGHPHLVKQLAGRYSRHLNREVDPFKEVAITVGASQALYLSLQTLIKPGELFIQIIQSLHATFTMYSPGLSYLIHR